MRVVRIPRQNQQATSPKKRRKLLRRTVVWLVVACLAAAGGNFARPLPAATITLSLPSVPVPQTSSLAWPTYGQASLVDTSGGPLLTHGVQEKIATASIAKVITALCVLQKHPLASGQIGPTLTMTEDDVTQYRLQVAQNGSHLPVYVGEQLTQYQALQALMIPSANNIADTLAVWAFGSLEKYSDYANDYVRQHGLTNTRIGTADASGLDPSTVSTAEDLARLGQLALKEPVLREIAAQRSAVFPYAGTVTNYNTKLGSANISGIKTGNNVQNKGALLYAAAIAQIGSSDLYITGAVMGADSLEQALESSEALVKSAAQNYEVVPYVSARQSVGTLHTAWGATTPVITDKALEITRLKSTPLYTHTSTETTPTLNTGSVGTIELRGGDTRTGTTISQAAPVAGPSLWWRLTRH
jgi:D-alanyl-D-alanine carboxypeptidase (penicillin-binding protein 5/6)